MPRGKKTDVVDETTVKDDVVDVADETTKNEDSTDNGKVELIALSNIKSGNEFIVAGETIEVDPDEAEYLVKVGAAKEI